MGISQLSGTPWHVERYALGKWDDKRHRSRCVYYKKKEKTCQKLYTRCIGSAHCKYYLEEQEMEAVVPEPKTRILAAKKSATPLVSFPPGCRIRHKMFGEGVVKNVSATHITIQFASAAKKLDLQTCTTNHLLQKV